MAGRGPFSFLAASTRSSFSAERQRRIDRLGDQRDRECPGPAMICTVHLPVPFWPAVSRILSTSGCAVGVLVGEDVAGDLDEVGVQFALVPLGEDLRASRRRVMPRPFFIDVVGFADELHVAVLDAVVDHLHVVAGAAFAHPVAAGRCRPRPWRRWPGRCPSRAATRPGEPPGMMHGPWRAPSSPPDTPVPM